MKNILIEAPFKLERRTQINRFETDEFKPVGCKIIDVKEGLLRQRRKLICVGVNSKDVRIFDLK